MSAFWLVQRLTREDSPRKGFDGRFRCQYMGSAEFEFGALPESLARIRKGRNLGTTEVEIVGHRAYVFGAREKRAAAAEHLPAWVASGCPGQERSYFDDLLLGSEACQEVDAWWALQEDVFLALSLDVIGDIASVVTR